MNIALVVNWNARVRDDDRVYILGDITMSDEDIAIKCLKMLNGEKIIIPGNHDTYAHRQKFLEGGLTGNYRVESDIYGLNDPYADKKIILCHYPLAVWRGKERGALHFYGHVHNSTPELYRYLFDIENSFNVCADVQGLFPRTAREIISSQLK